MKSLVAECLGTAMLLIGVVGSGIMAEALTGDVALALLANAVATGCMLYVIITTRGPISGAHFNPAVTLAFWLRKDIPTGRAFAYVGVQIAGGILGVWLAHLMFDLPILQLSTTDRTGIGMWSAEAMATFGLLSVISEVAVAEGGFPSWRFISVYWFTASTSFANPAVTIARALSDTFAGINPAHAPAYIIVQLVAAAIATPLLVRLFAKD